ncbi:MAG: metal-sensitive transcriptional regulator [Acidimicrobiia bacterium]|nr:metal-sensitive transcriptional regulator [Acidimicrobiia bacterium]
MRNETSSVGFRLRSMSGHLDGVIRMVDERRDCVEVLYQLSAVQGAVDMVRHQILESHLRRCVPESLSRAGVGDIVDDLLSATFGSAPPTVRAVRRCHLDAGTGVGSSA